jgi:hypothetical protein
MGQDDPPRDAEGRPLAIGDPVRRVRTLRSGKTFIETGLVVGFRDGLVRVRIPRHRTVLVGAGKIWKKYLWIT